MGLGKREDNKLCQQRAKFSRSRYSEQAVAFPSLASISIMANSPSHPPSQPSTSPWRCLLGAAIASGIALPLYFLSTAIIQSYADKPLPSTNQTAISIAIAVRTLVMGMSVLLTGIFALVAVGLFALAIQVTIQRWQNRSTSASN